MTLAGEQAPGAVDPSLADHVAREPAPPRRLRRD
jgi:hypothetical protein